MEAPITGSKIMEPMFADTKISYIFAPQLNVGAIAQLVEQGLKILVSVVRFHVAPRKTSGYPEVF